MRESQLRFILQQGFPAADASKGLYAALMFQPKVIGCLIVIGALFQIAWLHGSIGGAAVFRDCWGGAYVYQFLRAGPEATRDQSCRA